MSERKRKLQDPDYEDFSATPPKQSHVSGEEAQKSTEDQIRAIVSKHFATEERFREEQIAELQVTLSQAQETLADFRRAVVQHAYSRGDLLANVQPHTTWRHQPSGNQGRIHPAVKKLLGWDKKTQVPIVAGTPGQPTTRRKAAALNTPPLNHNMPSTSKDLPSASIATTSGEDTTTARLNAYTPDHSASSGISKPSTSHAVNIPSLSSTPSASKLAADSASLPSIARNPSLSSDNATVSSASIPIEPGVSDSKSWPTTNEREGLEESGLRMPGPLPPSDSKGVAKPCRQMRMVGRSLKQLVVGNTSRCLSLESRPGRASHKWMLYVRFRDNQSLGELVHHVVFTLHPSYAPNDVVKVTQPPFHLFRRGWGEFLARVNIHFRHPQDKPVEVTHHLKLDHSGSGVERLGSETHVKVWLHEANTLDFVKSESDHSQPAAADSDETRSPWDPSNSNHDSHKAEDSSETDDDNSEDNDSDTSVESLLIKEEPLSPLPAETNEDKTIAVKEEQVDISNSASPSAGKTIKEETIVIKEEPVDMPNSAMGLDIFYDDPSSFSEEIVEVDVEEVECKDEPMDVETLDIDWPSETSVKSEVEVSCEEEVREKPLTECVPTTSLLSASDQSCLLLSNTVPSSSESGTLVPSINLPTNSSQLTEGKIFIKLVQPGGKVVYMQVRQASNSVSAVGPSGQVIRTTGQLGQVNSNQIQVVRAPGQFIRTTSQGLPGAGASGVYVDGKRNQVNGHLRPRMITLPRPWLNGVAPTAPGRSVLRSVLKPLAIREVSIKKEPIDNITLFGPLMTTDPLETTTKQSLVPPAMIKQEPSILGPTKKGLPGQWAGSLTAAPMGLTAATTPHRDAIRRALSRCSSERCPSVERALATLALAMPLVDTRAAKPAFRCVHPYSAPSLETFFDWPHAKRRAAERQRAVALRRQMLTSGRPLSDVWPTRHIQRWLLLHGFVPTQADPAHQVTGRPIQDSYSEPALARAWLDQLMDEDVPEPEVDIMSVDEHLTSKRGAVPKVEPDHGHMDTLPMSAEMEHRCLELAETTRRIGITLQPEVIAGETLYQAAARVMLEALQLFTEEMLRRSLCKAWERNRYRPPSSLQPRDVRAAVKQYFPLLSNRGLGQSPTKGQPS